MKIWLSCLLGLLTACNSSQQVVDNTLLVIELRDEYCQLHHNDPKRLALLEQLRTMVPELPENGLCGGIVAR